MPLPGAGAIDPVTHLLIDDSVDPGGTYTYRAIALDDVEGGVGQAGIHAVVDQKVGHGGVSYTHL